MINKLVGSLTVLIIAILVSTLTAHAAAQLDEVRNLAENVLGSGQVKSLSAADNGQTILIRWESATFKPTTALADTRDRLYFETILATGSIIARMPEVVRIRFTIVRGTHMLATGEVSGARGTTLRFAPELGGGVYVPTTPPKRSVSDADATVLSQ